MEHLVEIKTISLNSFILIYFSDLCKPGWYMFSNNCYRIYDTSLTFWDAYHYCHFQNAGLINVYDVEEFGHIQDIW